MMDAATLAQMNGEYAMPADAGPAWRAAHAAGIDMSLIEDNMKLSPWERLLANDRSLSLIRSVQQGKPVADGTAH